MKTTWLLGALLLTQPAFSQTPRLTTTKFPDGSGQIGLAPGWKLGDAAQGAVSLSGPGGASMLLGTPLFVFSTEFDRSSLTPGVNPEVPRVPFDSPVRALIGVLSSAQKRGILSRIQLKGVLPAEGFPGKAVFVRYSVALQGKPTEVFGLYALMPTDNLTGTFYFSAIQAPTASFSQRLPEMMAMWRSWNLSPQLIQDRLNNAQKILGEIDMPGKLNAIQENQRKAALQGARQFQGYIRD